MPKQTLPENIQILSDSQARGIARAMLQSRKWWILPIVNESAVALALAIEKRHYADTASGDSVVLLGPAPALFLRKRRMPASALAVLMVELQSAPTESEAQWRETLGEQDILTTMGAESEDEATLARLTAWHDWMCAEVRR